MIGVMPTVSLTTPFTANPDAIYAVLADPVRYPSWAPGGGEARLADVGGAGVADAARGAAGGASAGDAGRGTPTTALATRARVVSFVDSPAGRLEQHVDYAFDPAARTVSFTPAASSPSPGFAGSFSVSAAGDVTYAIHVPDSQPSAEHVARYLESTSMPEFLAALQARLG